MKKSILAATALALVTGAFAQDLTVNLSKEAMKDNPQAQKLEAYLGNKASAASAQATAENTVTIESVLRAGNFDDVEKTAGFEDKETGVKITFHIAKHENKDYGDAAYKLSYNPAKIAGDIKITEEERYVYGESADPHAPMHVVALIEIQLKDKKVKKAEVVVLLTGKDKLQTAQEYPPYPAGLDADPIRD